MAGGVLALTRKGNRERLKAVISDLSPEIELDRDASTGSLTDSELATIIALAEVLYPPDTEADVAALARAHASSRCERDPGYLPAYRAAVELLNERAAANSTGKGFVDLSPAQRDGILHALLWSYSGRRFIHFLGRHAEAVAISAEALSLRRFVVADLLQAYYGSHWGWTTVGYSHYPGIPAADPLDYTRPVR